MNVPTRYRFERFSTRMTGFVVIEGPKERSAIRECNNSVTIRTAVQSGVWSRSEELPRLRLYLNLTMELLPDLLE